MKKTQSQGEQAFAEGNTQAPEQRSRNIEAKIKKIIILIFAGMTLFVVLCYTLARFIDLDSLLKPRGTDKRPNTIIFATPNYDEDIYADSGYMELDRNIYIYDVDTGLRESLEPDDYEVYGESVQFMSDFINSIIQGDVEKYNSFFADDEYCKESFTKQKLYNIMITKLSVEELTENNETWTQYEFALEYMIRHNNGTLRLDIESDACRPQYITVTDRRGKLLIQSMRFAEEK